MSKIVYLIGAGASYGKRDVDNNIIEGLPIIEEICNRFSAIGGYFKDIKKLFPLVKWDDSQLSDDDKKREAIRDEIYTGLEWLKREGNRHSSIDTFAKKLWFQHNWDDYKKLKRLLSFYFLVEQIKSKPDRRYDAFLASTLSDIGHLPEEITIVSWNYDSQFEISYDEYRDYKELDMLHKYDTNETILDYPARLYKINGSASFREGDVCEFKSKYNFEGEQAPSAELYDELITIYAKSGLSKRETNLSFAWEDTKYGDRLLAKLCPQIENAEVLIIIGYSFPFFNRIIDRRIINSMTKLKTAYFQDLNPETIMSRFNAINQNENIARIPQKDIGQFFLPPEL